INPAGRLRTYSGLLMTAMATCTLDYSADGDGTEAEIAVLSGGLPLKTLVLGCSPEPGKVTVRRGEKTLDASVSGQDGEAVIKLKRRIKLKAGETLQVTVR
ncbi:MAG: hypothetical protein R6V05_11215, partial [Candidatus Brocadiia bacterium]